MYISNTPHTQVLVMHRGKGIPLLALEEGTRALVTLHWTRLHLLPSYWEQQTDAAADPAAFVAREEPLPALDDRLLYTPSVSDHGCLLAVDLTSAPRGTVTRRLLLSRPMELDAAVRAAVEAAVAESAWVSGVILSCVCA